MLGHELPVEVGHQLPTIRTPKTWPFVGESEIKSIARQDQLSSLPGKIFDVTNNGICLIG